MFNQKTKKKKILEWSRGSSLSQSAQLGRLDCNESSQSKRDLFSYGAASPPSRRCPVRERQRQQFAADARERAGELLLGQRRWAPQSLTRERERRGKKSLSPCRSVL